MEWTGRLIGRQRDGAAVGALAVPGAVVTLVGPGGVGKTRLALEVAAQLAERAGHDTPVAMLGELTSDDDEAAVARALGFESAGAAGIVLADRAGPIVLDDAGRVPASVGSFVRTLRAAATSVTILVTSRQPLDLPDDRVYVVEPLAVPAPGALDAASSPAVELFLDRAAAAGAAIDGGAPGQLADVAELCRRLDGLPLAIELAAARARTLGPADLLAVVGERLDLLRRSSDTGEQSSMRAAIDVSAAALTPAARTFLRRLGVFGGPFDLELAHAVAGETGSDRATTADLLTAVVDGSLLAVAADGPVTRYRLLELLHAYAHEELVAAGEVAAVEERFVEAMLTVADRVVAEALARWDAGLLSAASSQFANLARATELCIERDPGPQRAYRLLLPMFAAVHEGRPNEVAALGAKVRARWSDAPAPWRPEALAVLASAAALAGRDDEVAPLAMAVVDDPAASPLAAAVADRAWGLATRTGDPATAARHFHLAEQAASALGFNSLADELTVLEAGELDLAGDPGRARAQLDEVLDRAQRNDDLFVTIFARLVRCRVLLRGGDVEAAAVELAAADACQQSIGQPWWAAAILRTAAAVATLGPGGWPAATAAWRAAIDDAASRGALGELSVSMRAAAATALHVGEEEAALVLQAAAPPSTAITVLPELFPDAVGQLAGRGPTAPPGRSVQEALTTARSLLGGAATQRPTAVPAVAASARTGALTHDGDGWRVDFAGRTTRVRDMKGLGDLAVLLSRPRTEIHALELMGASDVGGAAGPALDDRARRAYQERVIELQRDIDEAREHHDVRRAERAELELDALVEQLSEAFGLGGRARSSGSSAERARTAVTYRVRSAIRKLGERHPELERHLTNAVRTGTWCSYQPESDVDWAVTARD